MKNKSYGIKIKAPKEHVWDMMFGKDTYPKWAKGNRESPKVIGEWKEGNKIDFLDPDGGIRALLEIVERPNHMLIKRTAVLEKSGKNEIEDTQSIVGTIEEYILKEDKKTTTVTVKTYINEKFEKEFDDGYEKCFKLLKEICEN